jgi:hypothetical protein
MNLCALQSQRDLRDLARLHEWPDEVAWLEPAALAECSDPAVIAGSWVQDEPGEARKVLASRSSRGAVTVLVPRLPNLNYAQHIGAPAAVEVKFKSFLQVHLEDDRAYAIPGQAIIKSPMAHGKWGISEFGDSVVLATRATEDLGWTVLCTASLCARAVGVGAGEQLDLLAALLKRAASGVRPVAVTSTAAGASSAMPADVETLLADHGAAAAPWLLALLAAGRAADESGLREVARKFGLDLDASWSLAQLPPATPDQLTHALNRHGWGAYVRHIRQHLKEDSIHD